VNGEENNDHSAKIFWLPFIYELLQQLDAALCVQCEESKSSAFPPWGGGVALFNCLAPLFKAITTPCYLNSTLSC
jgi:hypothetical protein